MHAVPQEAWLALAGFMGGLLAGAYALVECLSKQASTGKPGYCIFMFAVGLIVSPAFALLFTPMLGAQIKMFGGAGLFPGGFVLGLMTMMAGPWIQRKVMAAAEKEAPDANKAP